MFIIALLKFNYLMQSLSMKKYKIRSAFNGKVRNQNMTASVFGNRVAVNVNTGTPLDVVIAILLRYGVSVASTVIQLLVHSTQTKASSRHIGLGLGLQLVHVGRQRISSVVNQHANLNVLLAYCEGEEAKK